jgi:hypothetical protein
MTLLPILITYKHPFSTTTPSIGSKADRILTYLAYILDNPVDTEGKTVADAPKKIDGKLFSFLLDV